MYDPRRYYDLPRGPGEHEPSYVHGMDKVHVAIIDCLYDADAEETPGAITCSMNRRITVKSRSVRTSPTPPPQKCRSRYHCVTVSYSVESLQLQHLLWRTFAILTRSIHSTPAGRIRVGVETERRLARAIGCPHLSRKTFVSGWWWASENFI